MTTPKLAAAKLAVMKAVPYLQKQRSPGLNYSYAGEAALLEKLHPAFVDAGLTFSTAGMKVVRNEVFTTAKGSAMNRVIVEATYRLTHVESGETESITALGEGSDVGDKATNKAMTGALKYALRQTFLIETGDDPDDTPSDGMERAGRAASNTPPNDKALVEMIAATYRQVKTREELTAANNLARQNGDRISDQGRAFLKPIAEAAKERSLTAPIQTPSQWPVQEQPFPPEGADVH